MARKTTPMNWTQTRQRGLLYACMGVASGLIVLGGFSVPLLKSLYVAGTTKHLFQYMFIGLANLSVAAISTVWWIPGIPYWWAHASLPNTEQLADPSNIYWVAWLGVAFIGGRFLYSSRHNFQIMRNAKQLAHEEHLKRGKLGPQKAVPPQHVVNVNARDIRESVIGTSNGANVALNSTRNNLPDIAELVSRMNVHLGELTLTPSQLMQFEAQLRAIQEQLVARTPNHSRLRESLRMIQHLLVTVGAHMLAGHWRDIVDTLRRLTER